MTRVQAAAVTLLPAIMLAAAILWWGLTPPSNRPRRYRPRHRRPWWPRRRRNVRGTHIGATADWSPAAEVQAAPIDPEPPHMSLASVLEEVTDEQLRADLETAHILAEVRAELDEAWARVEDAIIRDRMQTAATLARWERAVPPVYDRSAARQQTWADPFETVTGAWDLSELRALVGAS